MMKIASRSGAASLINGSGKTENARRANVSVSRMSAPRACHRALSVNHQAAKRNGVNE